MPMNKKLIILLVIVMLLPVCVTLEGSASSDNQEYNIALNKPYAVEFGASVEYSYRNYSADGGKYDIDDSLCLTDGVYAAVNDKVTGYYRAFRGYSRFICFDFGKEMRISGFSADFLHYNYGVYAPSFLNIYLSADGENYVKCGSCDTLPIYSATAQKKKYTFEFDEPYKAQYVKIEFASDVFVYCDEVEIYGNDDTTGCIEIPAYTEEEDKGVYPKYSEAMNGAGSIIKIYDGYYTDQSIADNTSKELLPYIAYLDGDGSIIDTMFDSVAFVPCHVDYPSGGRLVKTSGKSGAVMSDWELYISNTFKDGYNVKALEEAAGTMNASLGTDNKIKVFLTIPYPTMQSKAFGDINGDGKTEYTRTLAERTAVIEWYIDKVISLFNEQNFQNLELVGFYWYRESVANEDSDHEGQLITETKAYIDENYNGFCLLFDPYYLSEGFDKWDEYGFDGAVMQPNLIFNDYFETDMLSEFASQIKKYGLGVEIETAEPGNFNSAENNRKYGAIYESYLYYGWKYGYMNTLQTFYQGAGPGTIYKFYTSDDLYMNYLYDITYKFIKGTYDISAPSVVAEEFTAETDSKRNRINFTVNTDCYIPGLVVKASALNGKVTVLTTNAALLYTPNEGFAGEDEITLTVTDSYDQTCTHTVKVTVVSASSESSEETSEASEASVEQSAESNETTLPDKSDKSNKGLITAAVVLSVAIITTAIAFICNKRIKKKTV
ncbi:MAG: DUF4855 domain-containing protein [Eubacteriales bacterium]|nr:DUF4855 domain-containing protein [Eubacteriales bacterium]